MVSRTGFTGDLGYEVWIARNMQKRYGTSYSS